MDDVTTQTETSGVTQRPLRAQQVSRLLAKAGFDRADRETTSVRGHYRYSPGFEALGAKAAWEQGLTGNAEEAAVYVVAQTIDSFDYDKPKRPHREVVAETTAAYESALRGAGLTVERVERRGQWCLKVTR